MLSTGQIRLRAARAGKEQTCLQLSKSVTVLVIDGPSHDAIPFPASNCTFTLLRDVPLSVLLQDDFVAANVDDGASGNEDCALIGMTLQSRPSHTISGTLTQSSLLLSCPHETLPSIGLCATAAGRHRRKQAVPAMMHVGLGRGQPLVKRAKWALSASRLGTTDVAVSCGSALIHPPNGVQFERHHIVETKSIFATSVPDVEGTILNGMVDDTLVMLEHLQSIAVYDRMMFKDDVPLLEGQRKVQRKVYSGLCNGRLCNGLVECAKSAVAKGAAYAVVIVRAPAADVVWKEVRGRCGDSGFTLDAVEIFLVVKHGVFLAQLRAPCDAV